MLSNLVAFVRPKDTPIKVEVTYNRHRRNLLDWLKYVSIFWSALYVGEIPTYEQLVDGAWSLVTLLIATGTIVEVYKGLNWFKNNPESLTTVYTLAPAPKADTVLQSNQSLTDE